MPMDSTQTSSRIPFRLVSTKTSFGRFPNVKTSPLGWPNGAWRPMRHGVGWKSPTGQTWTTPSQTFRGFPIFRHPKKHQNTTVWTRSTPNCSTPLKNSVSLLKNKRNCRVLRLILLWTLCRWLPLLEKPWPKKGLFSVRYQKRLKNTRIWCANTLVQLYRVKTITMLR